MPGGSFTKGIKVGKLMAKDYRGVLVVILAMLRSTKGREILQGYKNFRKESDLNDWILLVESMLEWESYLNEPRMEKEHLKRLKKKHRYMMYLMRKIAQRNTGMGLKLSKFHMILHLVEDIIEFGVPLETDTSANESMHKPSKQASKMTQKAADTFNFQTSTRLVEFELIDLAMEEIINGNVPWDFYDRREIPVEELSVDPNMGEIWTGEARIRIFANKEGGTEFDILTRSKFRSKTSLNQTFLDFLRGLQDMLTDAIGMESLPIFTCHRRKGQTFRGHPNFRGKGAWRDWVWVDWGASHGQLPCHIWGFVELKNMPTGRNRLQYGGITLVDGVFAVVESSSFTEEDFVSSELMVSIQKEIQLDEDGNVQSRRFFLADTEAFQDPCCVIPDIGGPPNQYFVVKPRNQWAGEFVKWINEPHLPMNDIKTDEDEEESMTTSE